MPVAILPIFVLHSLQKNDFTLKEYIVSNKITEPEDVKSKKILDNYCHFCDV